MAYCDHADGYGWCSLINVVQEQARRIKELEAILKTKDQLIFAYESVRTPINPLAERIEKLEAVLDSLHFCYCGCSDDNIKAVEQALKG